MNLKRVKCFLTGGCRFYGVADGHLDKNGTFTATCICYKCGKEYSFTSNYARLTAFAEKLHREMEKKGAKGKSSA